MRKVTQRYLEAAFALIDFVTLFSFLAWEVILLATNRFGFTWWAKVETSSPNITYWFGPFLTKKSLLVHLSDFLSELSDENESKSNSLVKRQILRCSCTEPLTIIQSKVD